jgi:H+ antiporter protein
MVNTADYQLPMFSPLSNSTYLKLFTAQIVALLGTGLATIALGLLAYELAGADAGAVIGTALAIKMLAYVGVAPIAGAFADRLPRRTFLVGLDLVRAGVALVLPFVDQVWQIYLLIFVLQSSSAAFTPTFQATIPDVLPDERDYTKALSLSRLAYDLENLISPVLAAALLTLVSFHWLFAGTSVGFIASAALVLASILPKALPRESDGSIYRQMTRGIRIYLGTPRLRGLLALNAAAAASGAMVIVNSVVLVQERVHRSETDVAIAFAAFGGGSMVAALLLPRLLEHTSDRRIMLLGAGVVAAALAVSGLVFLGEAVDWWPFLILWVLIGIGYSTVLTPSGRLLRRSSQQKDRPAVFAAQFALSHACWLITYPLAGWLGADTTMSTAFFVLAGLALAGVVMALLLWPAIDPDVLWHDHDDLPAAHPHVQDATRTGKGWRHAHTYVVDDIHSRWPASG